MQVYTHSEQGKRSYQEDRLLAKGNLFAVCDGMGGHAHGDLAAESCVEELKLVTPSVGNSSCDLIIEALKRADKVNKDAGDHRGTTCTAVCVDEDDGFLSVVNVGDSGAVLLSDSYGEETARTLTVVHNDQYGYITSFIGGMSFLHAESVKYKEGDILVLYSDGISDAISTKDFKMLVDNSLSEEGNPAEDLCLTAIDWGSRDNCTVIVVVL